MAEPTRRPGAEPRHFTRMAVVLTGIILAGFGLETTRGRTDYAALPWTVYAHGLTSVAWCGVVIAQPWLIGRKRRDLHRIVGWVGATLAVVVALGGLYVTFGGVAAGRLRPPNVFMMVNLVSVACFLALVGAAIGMRRRSDWHRRLLICATFILTGPAWARILPMDLLGPFGLLAITAIVIALGAWGMVWDRRAHGRVHPAWWWGTAMAAIPGLVAPLAFVPAFAAWVDRLGPNPG